MPVYEYVCDGCGVSKDVKRDLGDSSEVLCPYCEAPMKRVFQSVPFTFKEGGTGARKGG